MSWAAMGRKPRFFRMSRRGTAVALPVGWTAFAPPNKEGVRTMLGTVLIVVLVLLVLGAIPTWPYSRGWGYFPSGLLGIVLLVLLILALTGRV
jgi:hypothetical protein